MSGGAGSAQRPRPVHRLPYAQGAEVPRGQGVAGRGLSKCAQDKTERWAARTVPSDPRAGSSFAPAGLGAA